MKWKTGKGGPSQTNASQIKVKEKTYNKPQAHIHRARHVKLATIEQAGLAKSRRNKSLANSMEDLKVTKKEKP